MTPESMTGLFRGRKPLRCSCGEELFVEAVVTEDGEADSHRFVDCECGTIEPILIPHGSLIGGFSAGPWHAWGPPSCQIQSSLRHTGE